MLCSAWLTLVASGKTASHYNSSSQSSCGSIFITFVTALLWTRSHQHRGKKRDAKFPASKSWTHKCLEAKKIPRDDWVLLRLQVPAGRHYSSWQLFEYLLGLQRARYFRASSSSSFAISSFERAEPRLDFWSSSFELWVSSFEPKFRASAFSLGWARLINLLKMTGFTHP